MNLVIDDAIEVKQPTKTEPEESRRSLGKLEWQTQGSRKLTLKQDKYYSRATMCR